MSKATNNTKNENKKGSKDMKKVEKMEIITNENGVIEGVKTASKAKKEDGKTLTALQKKQAEVKAFNKKAKASAIENYNGTMQDYLKNDLFYTAHTIKQDGDKITIEDVEKSVPFNAIIPKFNNDINNFDASVKALIFNILRFSSDEIGIGNIAKTEKVKAFLGKEYDKKPTKNTLINQFNSATRALTDNKELFIPYSYIRYIITGMHNCKDGLMKAQAKVAYRLIAEVIRLRLNNQPLKYVCRDSQFSDGETNVSSEKIQ